MDCGAGGFVSMLDFALGQRVKKVGVPDCQVQLLLGLVGGILPNHVRIYYFKTLRHTPIFYFYIITGIC